MSTATTSSFTRTLSSAGYSPTSWFLFRTLFMKECRQLASFFLAIGLLMVLLQMVVLVSNTRDPQEMQQSIAFLFPSLFAMGSGAILVSQEKELRTLQWLTSLPVPTYLIVLSKFLVAGLGLALIWCLALAVGTAVQPSLFSNSHFAQSPEYSSGIALTGKYVANSVFLLTAGFVSGWIFGSAWIAMVMVVPLAFLPVLLGSLSILNDGSWQMANKPFVDCLIYAVSSLLLLPLGYFFGRGSIAVPNRNWLAGIQFQRRDRVVPSKMSSVWKPWPSAGAALWQNALQNRMVWATSVSIVLLPIVPTLDMYFMGKTSVVDSIARTALLYTVIVGWLGASVFATDGFHDRIRFFSDRGVSPALVWWSRLLIPVLTLFTLIIVFAWAVHRYIPTPDSLTKHGVIILFWIGIFPATIWCSQWFRRSYLSFAATPAIAIGALVYFGEILGAWGIQNYWCIPAAIVPLIASRVMLRPWMDGRFDLGVKLKHAAFASLTLGIPLIPLFLTYLSVPTISRASRAELVRLAINQPANPVPVTFVPQPDPSTRNSKDWAGVVADELQNPLIQDNHGQRTGDLYQSRLELAVAEARLMKLRMVDEPAIKTWRTRYGDAIVAAWQISSQLRYNTRVLYQQERADRIESWLVSELLIPEHRECIPHLQCSEMVNSLGNREQRINARKESIAFTWVNKDLKRRTSNNIRVYFEQGGTFGVSSVGFSNPFLVTRIVNDRKMDAAAATLLQFAESGSLASNDPAYQRYLSIWPTPPGQISTWNLGSMEPTSSIPYPGALWHGTWETEAENLMRLLEVQR